MPGPLGNIVMFPIKFQIRLHVQPQILKLFKRYLFSGNTKTEPLFASLRAGCGLYAEKDTPKFYFEILVGDEFTDYISGTPGHSALGVLNPAVVELSHQCEHGLCYI